MGQTLTNGIYLPNEGEINCYSGLAANWNAVDTLKGNYSLHAINVDIHVTAAEKETWNGKADASALTAHTGDTTIHVTAEDKEAWNGKADNSALTAHTGNTTIHVTAEDKNKWDAVTSKANDSDVVHKSGDETVDGSKIFSHVQTGVGRNLYHFTSSPYSKNTPPANISYQYIWFIGNSASQGLTNNWFGGYLEQLVNTNGSTRGRWFVRDTSENATSVELWASGSDKQFRPTQNGNTDLGTPTNKWKSFNGLTPSSLSLPSGNLNDIIDISSYLTHLDGTANTYIAPANGWISIAMSNSSGIQAYINGLWGHQVVRPSVGGIRFFMPILKDKTANILIFGGTIDNARFIPCQGNV